MTKMVDALADCIGERREPDRFWSSLSEAVWTRLVSEWTSGAVKMVLRGRMFAAVTARFWVRLARKKC